MTTWWEAAGLRPAQLGGEEIIIETIRDRVGRRLVAPLLPGSDQRPPSIDLGKIEAPWSVSAYVIGDYLPAYQRLRALFDRPGPYTFTHPYLGEFSVDLPDGLEIEQDMSRGGIAFVTFTAIPASEAKPYSEPVASPRDQVRLKASAAIEKIQTGFPKRYPGKPFLNFLSIAADAIGRMADTLGDAARRARSFAAPITDLTDSLYDLQAQASTLAATPAALATMIGGLINAIFSFIPTPEPGTAEARALRAATLDALEGLTTFEAYPEEDRAGLPSETVDAYAAAFEALLGGIALAEAQIVLRALPLESTVEAEAITATLAAKADAYLLAPGVDEDTEEALQDLRTSWAIFVSSVALPETREIELPTERSAIALAMELYGDPTRGEEICELNDLLEASFLPPGVPLKVLAR